MARHRAFIDPATRSKLSGSGRHVKRTTVKLHWMSGRDEWGWRIDYSTFDRPTNPYVVSGPGARLRALDEARAFEKGKHRG